MLVKEITSKCLVSDGIEMYNTSYVSRRIIELSVTICSNKGHIMFYGRRKYSPDLEWYIDTHTCLYG